VLVNIVTLEPFEIWQQDVVRSSEEFENGCIRTSETLNHARASEYYTIIHNRPKYNIKSKVK